MDYLTGVVLSGITYDLVKNGFQISAINLKSKLKNWLTSDQDLEILAARINSINQLEDLNESAICKRLETDSIVQNLIVNIKRDNFVSNVTQYHSGTGDNISGDKVINQTNHYDAKVTR